MRKSSLSIFFSIVDYASDVYYRNLCLTQHHKDFLLCLFSRHFDPFWINFCIRYRVRIGFRFLLSPFSPFSPTLFSQQMVLKKKKRKKKRYWIVACQYGWRREEVIELHWYTGTFCFVSLIYIFILLPILHYLDDYTFVVSFKSGSACVSLFFPPFWKKFGYTGFFAFPYEF